MNLSKIAISGGGTGGHFFPALAFMEKCDEEDIDFIYIGNSKGIEYKFRKYIGDRSVFLPMEGYAGKGIFEKSKALILLVKNSLTVYKMLDDVDASVVFGGYTGMPLGVCSLLKRIPLFIHEQNSVPGVANIKLERFTRCIFYTFEYTKRFFKNACMIRTGMPLRKALKEGIGIKREEAIKKLGIEDKPTILFMGGSQGAMYINKLALEVMEVLKDFQALLITGNKHYEDIKRSVPKGVRNIKLIPFTEDIPLIYRASHIAVARAGAGTVAELSYYGLPALFIPYPYASGDHQYYNAKEIEERGGGIVIREKEADAKRVIEKIEKLFSHRDFFSEGIRNALPVDAENTMLKVVSKTVN